MRFYSRFIRFVIICLIYRNTWVLAESVGKHPSSNQSSGAGGGLGAKTNGSSPGLPSGKAAERGFSGTADLKLFKNDGNGNSVLMVENTDFEKKYIYDFKGNAKCVLVKFDDKDVWKKGDENVDKPNYVAYNETLKRIVIRDSERAVTYKKDSNSDEWKQATTTERQLTYKTGSQTGSSATTPPSSGGQSSNNPSGGSSSTAGLKLFKDDGNGNTVEMAPADYEKKYIYDLKSVKCTLIKLGEEEMWKKGDYYVDEPNYVAYDPSAKIIVRDDTRAVVYKKDANTGKWNYTNTILRQRETGTAKTGGQAGSTGSHGSGLSSTTQPEAGGSSATPQPSSGGVTTANSGQGATTAPPAIPAGDGGSKSNESVPVIKLFQKDPNDATKNVEMDQSSYTVVNTLKHTTYKFKKNANCSLVKCNNEEVWKTDKNDINTPKFVTYYNEWNNRMAIGDGKKAVFYQFDNSEWKYFSTISYKTEGNRDELSVDFGGQCFNYKKGSDGNWSYETGVCTNLAKPEPVDTIL